MCGGSGGGGKWGMNRIKAGFILFGCVLVYSMVAVFGLILWKKIRSLIF
jgi:hypothetical protein